MLTYEEAAALYARRRRGSCRKRLALNTYLHYHDGDYIVVFHQTPIVNIHSNGCYTVRTGGWATLTTRQRIMQYVPIFIYQQRRRWWVPTTQVSSGRIAFRDEMMINRHGQIVYGGTSAPVCAPPRGLAGSPVRQGGGTVTDRIPVTPAWVTAVLSAPVQTTTTTAPKKRPGFAALLKNEGRRAQSVLGGLTAVERRVKGRL